ncbi:MAG: GNAT family N-acetyltransferase, partial [Erysipelotrichaceae bacterium]|nr:GNAT family N-acetyltransferase [Erysipelotrichaceae bacterium]
DELISLYLSAFPKEERKPYEVMEDMARRGRMRLWAVEDDEGLCALAYFILGREIVILDYLAVHPDKRDQLIGSWVLNRVFESFDKPVLVEIESTLRDADPMKVRRKNFYLRNGLRPNPYEILLAGIPMEMMSTAPVSFDQYYQTQQEYLTDWLGFSAAVLVRKLQDLPEFD